MSKQPKIGLQQALDNASKNVNNWPAWKKDIVNGKHVNTTSSVQRFAPSSANSSKKY
ncbi:hypothetical protein CV_0128 [Chromobacterium violaceum ATCC 12472]|uniref:Uncharacterized protein n=1 Tax=Chromobacterium violaceum (strain ATCC 12472 / DSM 30191 / JCM 1249 / CCUG 213 / NBRC 12614 / NCIMB 9131 / NCTC 9757 / MK) TaxID=243365 RepID=Q7P1T5_CHRVO|nr:hypothetical protein CV_0128 [Chromobacterium violaceum ATCC 12472]